MASVTIQIPDELVARVEEQAVRAGHTTVGEFVSALLQQELERGDANLETELVKGLDSPAEEMTDEHWDEMRRELLRRHGRNRA